MLTLILQVLNGDPLIGFLSESTTVLIFGAGLVASAIAVRRLLKRNDAVVIGEDETTASLQDEGGC